MSVACPGGNGTTRRTGFEGNAACASAAKGVAASVSAPAAASISARIGCLIMLVLMRFGSSTDPRLSAKYAGMECEIKAQGDGRFRRPQAARARQAMRITEALAGLYRAAGGGGGINAAGGAPRRAGWPASE